MKNYFLRLTITKAFVVAFILVFSFGASILSAQETEASKIKRMSNEEALSAFKADLFEAIKIYLELKDALVGTNAEKATEKAKTFNAALAEIDGNVLKDDLKKSWDEISSKLKTVSEAQILKSEIKTQREAFYPLTQTLLTAIEAFGPFESPLYMQHCPMAFDNTGGDWISDSKEVRNPYFGSMMLKCGSVKQTFSQKKQHSENDS